MLTGSVVGDGEYTVLEDLFDQHESLNFSGTLTRVHDCGENILPITIVLSRAAPTATPHPTIHELRQTLGWRSELVGCLVASISIPPLGRHNLPMTAALDVDPSDVLRLLSEWARDPNRASRARRFARRPSRRSPACLPAPVVSPDAPLLGRIICRIFPKAEPPKIDGLADGSPAYGVDSAVRCTLQKRPPPPPPPPPPAAAADAVLGAMGGALSAMYAQDQPCE